MKEERGMYAEKSHILVVDDDDRLRDLLFRLLTGAGYVVACAPDAASARDMMTALSFDMMVVDVMMPGQSGVELTANLRAGGQDIPVLLLTALGDAPDRIKGLEAGADDYLGKPFEPRELLLRIEAILRRRAAAPKDVRVFTLGPWRVDLGAETLADTQGEQEIIRLSAADVKLLRALAQQVGQPVSRYDLAAACGVNPDERTIDVQVTRLRRRLLDDPKDPRYIQTVRGQGYQLMIANFRPGG